MKMEALAARRDSMTEYVDNSPRRVIAYLWFGNLAFVFLLFICAIVTASENDQDGDGNKSAGFAAIFTILLCAVLSYGGTMVMRKYQTSLAIGFFLGACVMMTQIMFVNFVYFMGKAREGKEGEQNPDRATSAFSFLLCLGYGIFSFFLHRYRHRIIRDTSTEYAPAKRHSVSSQDGMEMLQQPLPV